MKISEVKTLLDEVMAEHGDIDFVLDDPDTGWRFVLESSRFEVWVDEDGKRLEVTADYNDKRYGA